MTTSRAEQETVVSYGRNDDVVSVYTNSTTDLRKLRSLVAHTDLVTEIRGARDWGDFTVRRENFSVLTAIRRKRALSEPERAARAARLAKVRNGGTHNASDLQRREPN